MKTKPIGVRFDEKLLEDLRKEHGITTPQKALNHLTDIYFSVPYFERNKKTTELPSEEKKEYYKQAMTTPKEDILKLISDYETELKNLGEGRLGKMRKKFVENQIYTLKKQLQ